MNYLLDTNTCIIYLKGRDLTLEQGLGAIPSQKIAVCSIVKAEFCLRTMKSPNPGRNFAIQQTFFTKFISLPFENFAATGFEVSRAQLEIRGISIGAYDLKIAAIALTSNLTLVNHNTQEFGCADGLQVEDWEVSA